MKASGSPSALIEMYEEVHGPTPGMASSLASSSSGSAPGSMIDLAVRNRFGDRNERLPPPCGHREDPGRARTQLCNCLKEKGMYA